MNKTQKRLILLLYDKLSGCHHQNYLYVKGMDFLLNTICYPLGKPTSRWFPTRGSAYARARFLRSTHFGWAYAGSEDVQMISSGGHCQTSFQSGRDNFISPSCVIA